MSSQERFGYEWSHFRTILPEYEHQFRKWVTPLGKKFFRGKTILDAGCGIGRNSYWPLKYGAKEITAFDFDYRTVQVARENLAHIKNAAVKFANIYNIPWRNKFDISHAIGVIQHLENPPAAINQLVKATKQSGIVLIWVLAKEGNGILIIVFNFLRLATARLPLPLVDLFSYVSTLPIYILVRFLPLKHPYIKQLSKYRFTHLRSIILDHLIPMTIHYWSKDEARDLLANAGLSDIRINRVNKNSWTVIGTKR